MWVLTISGIGGIFHQYAKGVRQTPYLARNFQRNLVRGIGEIRECSTLDAQVAFLDVMLGHDRIDICASTGGDGSFSKITTAARKVLESQGAPKTIDTLLFHHNKAGTQNVFANYYGLPSFWQLGFASMVHRYRLFLEGKAPPLETYRVPQLEVRTSYQRKYRTLKTVEYGGMFIGALLNRFLAEHYRLSAWFDPLPHYLADLSVIARGAVQPSYARPFFNPVKGLIYIDDNKEPLPIDRFNFLLVFSNDWNIDLKLTDLSPCRALRKPENKGKLQIVVGDADMPAAVYNVARQALGLDWKAKRIHSVVARKVRIITEERQYNLDGDFHPTGGDITITSGFSVNLIRDYSKEYLDEVFSGDENSFFKFLDDFSDR